MPRVPLNSAVVRLNPVRLVVLSLVGVCRRIKAPLVYVQPGQRVSLRVWWSLKWLATSEFSAFLFPIAKTPPTLSPVMLNFTFRRHHHSSQKSALVLRRFVVKAAEPGVTSKIGLACRRSGYTSIHLIPASNKSSSIHSSRELTSYNPISSSGVRCICREKF